MNENPVAVDEVNKELHILNAVLQVESEHLALRLNGYTQEEATSLIWDLRRWCWHLIYTTYPPIPLDIPQNWDVG